jgi:hypothetical protein
MFDRSELEHMAAWWDRVQPGASGLGDLSLGD